MTREEIAKWLENLKGDIGKSENQPLWHYAEALDMAIEALQTDIVRCGECEHQAWYKAQDIYEALEAVPSADRPRGEWIESREQNILMAKRIEKGETWRVCSNCGTGFMIGAQLEEQKCYGERFHNFCPRCGADMRGDGK